ncbi:conserved hypothetical protein [Chthoniobacter flavus Ellin428]|uniref:Uncharacterized protein n=1 Tax=Chthoniobacter flavus Ellin428 TaxID=497964 RepID=B4D3C6_9BACT|nr:hypothetical protein [Chthoniobacter flavus]EDY19237.1 conserved hypothetical protein [Chthoniobacter flavus Ellin428]TCO88080.1 hypothetical protein EV701_119124 [Chthoniobacter flavus]
MDSRPQSLKEVAERILAGSSAGFALRNFLDEFYLEPRLEMLLEEPPKTGVRVTDCYLAATADELGTTFFGKVPRWASSSERTLEEPHFGFNTPLGRAYALIATPGPFRQRNLFIGEDALKRA